MDAREFGGLELAAKANIKQVGAFWTVPCSVARGVYRVNADATTCTCDDFELTARPCKHVYAVRFVKQRNRGTPIPMPTTEEEASALRPKKPTYKQVWPAYNAAQVREKEHFLELLADLCGTVPDRQPKSVGGRPRYRERDALFAAAYKVYSGFSGRRFSTDLRNAQAAGHCEGAPHYNSVFRVLEDAAITPVLNRLIIRSSLPLKAVETNFAVDSTGFGTGRFSRWFDHKYGVERSRAEWVKVHACVGVKTNIVTAIEVSDRADGPVLPGLVATTAQNFALNDVAADKAYLSQENLEFIEAEGGHPLVPFKINSKPDRCGATWERLYHYFHLHRAEFLPRYHRRSNVEAAFSMVKRKFGDTIRSKTEAATRNEVLFKVLCHNLVVLIHEMYELGIDPTLGDRQPEQPVPDDAPAILRFPGVG